eukprot:2253_1
MPYLLAPSFIIWLLIILHRIQLLAIFNCTHYDTFRMVNIFNCIMKSYHPNYKIQTEIDTDTYYTYCRDALVQPIIPHGFATKTKGAVPHFIAVSWINFISQSNQVH